MVKRFLSGKGSVLITAILVAALLIGITYYRMEKAKNDLDEYWIGKSCPNKENCRQKVEATILNGQEKSLTVNVISKTGNTYPHKKTFYHIWVSLNSGEHEIQISPNPPSNGTPFDISDVRIPSGADPLFVEENFYKGEPAYVELWKDKITILYIDSMTDIPEPVIQSDPLSGSQLTLTNNKLPQTYEIALPTTIHPIFRQAGTEYDFTATTLISSFITIVLALILYNKEIDQVWQKVKTSKIWIKTHTNRIKRDK